MSLLLRGSVFSQTPVTVRALDDGAKALSASDSRVSALRPLRPAPVLCAPSEACDFVQHYTAEVDFAIKWVDSLLLPTEKYTGPDQAMALELPPSYKYRRELLGLATIRLCRFTGMLRT